MGTKNNPQNRGQGAKGKEFGGKPIKPVMYLGSQVGHGKFVAAQYENGDLVLGQNGAPIPWDAI